MNEAKLHEIKYPTPSQPSCALLHIKILENTDCILCTIHDVHRRIHRWRVAYGNAVPLVSARFHCCEYFIAAFLFDKSRCEQRHELSARAGFCWWLDPSPLAIVIWTSEQKEKEERAANALTWNSV